MPEEHFNSIIFNRIQNFEEEMDGILNKVLDIERLDYFCRSFEERKTELENNIFNERNFPLNSLNNNHITDKNLINKTHQNNNNNYHHNSKNLINQNYNHNNSHHNNLFTFENSKTKINQQLDPNLQKSNFIIKNVPPKLSYEEEKKKFEYEYDFERNEPPKEIKSKRKFGSRAKYHIKKKDQIDQVNIL